VRLVTDLSFLAAWGQTLRDRLERGVGIPVTVGIAPTKTLAKLATEMAKRDPLGSGVQVLTPESTALVAGLPLSRVWGIGQQIARRLLARRIETVGQLVAQEQAWIRQEFGLGGERTWRELRGESCLELTEALVNQRQILRSRSFGAGVTTLVELTRAVAEYLEVAVKNLRRHQLRASLVSVFIRTSRFSEGEARFHEVGSVGLAESTSYLPTLMIAARQALQKIYRPGFFYKKAGVILSGLEKETAWQPALTSGNQAASTKESNQQKVMSALENINRRFGERGLVVGTALTKLPTNQPLWGHQRLPIERWRTKALSRSQEYTTNWTDLRLVQ
jgi:DNA polymerase V